ncbi:hypothetical protein [Streptomyces odontomachi]|uniref:hypothetical protein n=1 Tax=Streptomyces odontomachi TaxID=2944940 RepID=UPI0021096C47|nr:hypothetical protein [Streptomyces sp. ODS25]
MAKITARYTTPGGGTVTLHTGGLLSALAGRGAWYECTGCQARNNITRWSNRAQADLVDYDATERAASDHANVCRRHPTT